MSSSVPVAGGLCPRAHNRWPETVSSRMSKPGGKGPLSEHYLHRIRRGDTKRAHGYQAPGAAATLVLAPYDQYEVGTP
jgi:hypothetical protein